VKEKPIKMLHFDHVMENFAKEGMNFVHLLFGR
jgi:hypothetical protein